MMAESGNGDSDSALPVNSSSSTDDLDEINPASLDESKSSETSEDTVVCSSTSAKLDGRQPSVRRKFRTLTFGRRYSARASKENSKKRNKGAWNFKIGLNCCRRRRTPETDIPEPNISCNSCVCTGYRRTEEHHLGAGIVFEATPPAERRGYCNRYGRDYRKLGPQSSEPKSTIRRAPVIDLYRFNPEDYPIDDWDEKARAERAREIEEGIDPPPGYQPSTPTSSISSDFQVSSLSRAFQNRLSVNSLQNAMEPIENTVATPEPQVSQFGRVTSEGTFIPRTVHTQVDYIHCLVPDLLEITQCSFYWGKMDRYEAEKLLENRPEGTFLLRDSAQEEYLFSVSFRRYSRSLHARIEQWNHKFSFDSHDPGVFASDTVCGLIEHYKDPSCCMFFEPMLTIPLHRTFAFPLQHLCRSVICHNTTYDNITKLQLPKTLKAYLKEYHYKQRVRVRRFEMEQ